MRNRAHEAHLKLAHMLPDLQPVDPDYVSQLPYDGGGAGLEKEDQIQAPWQE